MEHTDASGWGNEATARAYAAYARAYPMYRETARDLVAIAQVAPGAVVIDLACGTGVVTEELLGRVGVAGHVTGVDSSRAMLDIARGQIRAHNVRFVQAPAEQLPTLVASQVDIVVCNSAFWQLPLAETLHAIAAVLASRGRFTFNLPWRFFRPVAKEDTPVAPPSLLQLMVEIAINDYGYRPPARPPRRALDLAQLETLVAASGLRIASQETITYCHQQSPAEQVAFLRIPVMTERQFPDLRYPVRMELLDQACQRYEPHSAASRWTYFVTMRGTAPS